MGGFRDTLDKVQNEIASSRKSRTAARQEMDRLQSYERGISLAREAGDLELFTKLSEERDRISDTLSGLRKELSKPVSGVSKEVLVSLWQADTADYNRAFQKKLAAYDKARHALSEAFIELVGMQRSALELREDTAKTILELDPDAEPITDPDELRSRIDYSVMGLSGLALLPVKEKPVLQGDHPAAAYFVASGDIPESRRAYINRVAGRQLP